MSLSQTRVNPTQDPNYAGASGGPINVRPDMSGAVLFEGIANTVGTATKAVDESIQRNIQKDIWEGYDREIGAQGNDAFVEYQSGRDGTPLDIRPLPAAITGKGNSLAKLQQARDEGRISDAYYYGRLDSMVRELRAKYPGYREQIDTMVSQITGVQPANALRRAILAELDLAANQQSEYEKFVWANAQYAGPWADVIAQGGRPPENEFRAYVAQQKTLEADLNMRKLTASVGDIENGRVVADAKRGLTLDADINFNRVLAPVLAQVEKLNGKNFDATSEEGVEVLRQVNHLVNVELESIWQEIITAPLFEGSDRTWRSVINDVTELNKLKEQAFARPKALVEALQNNQTGILQLDRILADLRKNEDLRVYLDKFPIFRDVMVMREVMGNELVNSFMLSQAAGISMLNQLGKAAGAMAAYRMTRAGNSFDKMYEELMSTPNITDEERRQIAAGIFLGAEHVFLNPRSNDEELANAVENIFGEKGRQVFANFQEKKQAFDTMAGPQVAQRIARLDENSRHLYREALTDWFNTVHDEDIANLRDAAARQSDVLKLVRDENGYRYELTEAGRATSPESMNGRDIRHRAANGDDLTKKINATLGVMENAMRVTGGNMDAVHRNLDYKTSMNEFAPAAQERPTEDVENIQVDPMTLPKAVGGAVDSAIRGAIDVGRNIVTPDTQRSMLTPEGQAALDAQRPSEYERLRGEVNQTIEQAQRLLAEGKMSPEEFERARTRAERRLQDLEDIDPANLPAEGSSPMQATPQEVQISETGEISITPYSPQEVALGIGYTDQERDEEAPEVQELASIRESLRAFFENLDKGSNLPEVRRAKPILDLIGRAEAPQGYNQIFGRNRSAPLNQMTVAQVMDLQNQMVRSGSPSSAVGRYQFIRKTLRGLVESMGIDPNEKFTPELQDRLAMALLERRGLSQFLSGRMSARRFQQNLSMEWAGLPSLNGRSYYAGDGLNKATVSVAQLIQALSQLRS